MAERHLSKKKCDLQHADYVVICDNHHFKSRMERHIVIVIAANNTPRRNLLSLGFSLLTPGKAKRDLLTAVFRWISSDNGDENYNWNNCGCGKRHWLCGLTGFVSRKISGTSSKE